MSFVDQLVSIFLLATLSRGVSSYEINVRPGDKVRCSAEGNHSSPVNYTWIDTTTGNVIQHGPEWTIKPCIHGENDDREMINCVNFTDGLLMVECHVTVGMTTDRAVVGLRLVESVTSTPTRSTTLTVSTSNVDECRLGQCEQLCFNTPGSYQCSCRPGFTLDNDKHNCSDINECDDENGGCQHRCVNTPGNYTCHCLPGYDINDDGKTCNEKPVTAFIWPSSQYDVSPGHKMRCSVEGNHSALVNYTWVDSATGTVIHHGAEWTVKPCIYTDDDHEMINNCVNFTDGLLMLECHVTVGMTTTRAVVALRLVESVTMSTNNFSVCVNTEKSPSMTEDNSKYFLALIILFSLLAVSMSTNIGLAIGVLRMKGKLTRMKGAKYEPAKMSTRSVAHPDYPEPDHSVHPVKLLPSL